MEAKKKTKKRQRRFSSFTDSSQQPISREMRAAPNSTRVCCVLFITATKESRENIQEKTGHSACPLFADEIQMLLA